jgi:hypothetical protein
VTTTNPYNSNKQHANNLRVVTPMAGRSASPRVPTRTQNLSPRDLSQNDFWSMETSNMAIALGTNHCSQKHFSNAVVHPVTGNQMEYMVLMNEPYLQPLWKRGFSNEAGCLVQGIRDIPGTNTFFFVELKTYPETEKSHTVKLCVTTNLTKR